MKPNLKFLQKVADGKVYPFASYSPRTGRQDKFRGGEATAKAHEDGGFVVIRGPHHVMASGSVELTDKGREALASAT
jgi:hypothetical protein